MSVKWRASPHAVWSRSRALAGVLSLGLLVHWPGSAGAGEALLSLNVSGGNGPALAGDVVVIALILSDLGGQEAAGFQAFLEFDESKLLPISVEYTPAPFGLPILSPIPVGQDTIDLASGIDVLGGQMPTSVDGALAVVQFMVLQDSGCVNSVFFRSHEPPTRVTDAFGEPIALAVLVGLGSGGTSDLTGDGSVGVDDLLILLASWGPCEPNEPCPADLDCNGVVGVSDLLMLLSQWG